MRIEYVAEDGTRFDTESECRLYESIWEGKIWGIWKSCDYPSPNDITVDMFKVSQSIYDAVSIIQDYHIVYIKDKEVLDSLRELNSVCIEGLSVGVNYWDTKEDRWVEASKHINKLRSYIDELKEEMELFQKCESIVSKVNYSLK